MATIKELKYTDKELAAIEILKEKTHFKFTAKEWNIAVGTLVSLVKKADAFPGEAVAVKKEKAELVCAHCGTVKEVTLYWLD